MRIENATGEPIYLDFTDDVIVASFDGWRGPRFVKLDVGGAFEIDGHESVRLELPRERERAGISQAEHREQRRRSRSRA